MRLKLFLNYLRFVKHSFQYIAWSNILSYYWTFWNPALKSPMLFNRHGEIKLCLVRLNNYKVGHEFKNKADTGNIWLYSQLFCTKAILIQNWMFWCSPWWPVWRNFRAAKPSQARPCSKVCLWVAAVQSVKEVCWLAQIQKISSFILNSREDFCNCPTFRPVNLVPPKGFVPPWFIFCYMFCPLRNSTYCWKYEDFE